MAYICYKEKGSCPNCEHYRYDVDKQAMACWATFDIKLKNLNEKSKNVVDNAD